MLLILLVALSSKAIDATPRSVNTRLVNKKGHASFAIKIYREHEDYPDGGRMSQYLEKLNVGESIMVEGPVGRFKYKGWGNFEIKKEKVKYFQDY